MTKEQFKKKWENYWFYYKIHTIVAIILILVVGILVKQCADRVMPDMTVIIVTKNVDMSQNQITNLQNNLEKYTADVNGDGRKVVFCDFYYMNDKQNGQMISALNQKLMATISATDTALFVTDNNYYKQFNGKNDFFFKLNKVDKTAPNSYKVALSSLPDFKISKSMPGYENLTLSIRSFDSSFAADCKGASFKNSANVLKKLLQNGRLAK